MRSCWKRRDGGGIDIYFEGDSITRRWGATDYPDLLANWRKNFFGRDVADFGWGADTMKNPRRLKWRCRDGVYRVIVFLAGTNNVGRTSNRAERQGSGDHRLPPSHPPNHADPGSGGHGHPHRHFPAQR